MMRETKHGIRKMSWATGVLIVVAGAILVGCGGSSAAGPLPADPFASADVARGGVLYDKWWTINGGIAPVVDHPDYPAVGIKTGADTWRCKECHGWDYTGVLGHYAGGSHFTGIDGVFDNAGDDQNALFAAIKGTAALHDFSAVLSDADIWDLVKFLKQGQVDMLTHITLATGVALGSPAAGQPLYESNCIACHGYTGRKILFKPDVGVGDLADAGDNPWETLHKIRWGHPGSSPMMPSMVVAGLSETDHGDILAHAQTNLAKGAELSYATDVHPVWTAQGCVACHTVAHPTLDLTGAPAATLTLLQGLAGTIDSANEANSNILLKPLAVAAGGAAHGGGDVFPNTSDPSYRLILQWLEEGEAP